MKDENTRRRDVQLPPESVPAAGPRPVGPVQELQDAMMRIHVWQEQRSLLARLGQPDTQLVARCNDEIAKAQADADVARRALGPQPKEQ
jgi:hypothetical protein